MSVWAERNIERGDHKMNGKPPRDKERETARGRSSGRFDDEMRDSDDVHCNKLRGGYTLRHRQAHIDHWQH